MTVVVEEPQTPPVVEEPSPNDPAGWHLRAGALAVDVLPALAVVATMALVALTMPLRSTWWWVCVVVGAATILIATANRVMLPAVRGWSLGRALCGITVVRPDGAPVGAGRLVLRDLAHLLDTLSVFVGWLWPLWDGRRRTFADMVVRTEVHRLDPARRPADIRRLGAVAGAAATLLCVAGAALSTVTVYLPMRASDHTRAEIAEQGPKIVTEMLSYDPATLHDDFTRAQSLTTDKYRELLVAQYSLTTGCPFCIASCWATNDAVLSATPKRATMLVFLQGHRGAGDAERYITATVRVSFVKGAAAHWLVDELTVVTKPKPPKGEK